MAVFKCKMCGGDLEIQEGLTICECEYCGTKQTIPALDNEKKLNLFNRANRLRLNSEFDKAASIYENIIAEFPEEAEGYWGLVLCNYGIEYVDDPATAKKIPTCHRAAFESVTNDENYQLALEYADVISQKVYRDEAREIDRIMSEILSISKNEEPYDIFICYKETDTSGGRTIDSVIAQDVYDALTDKGYRVFFSKISLEDKLGKQYEPYIFAALNSAKVMLAFGTKYEYFHAVWVKNEWSRFLKLMAKDKSKSLVPCYKDLDPYDMPDEFKALQAQDMGKVGAIQDLVRGIDKLISKKEPAHPVKETVVVNNAASATVDSLLKRVFLFLADGDWQKANEYCEKVLDIDPENGQAYLGKLMADIKIHKVDLLKNCLEPFDDNPNYQKILRFCNESTKRILSDSLCTVKIAKKKREAKSKAKMKTILKNEAQKFKKETERLLPKIKNQQNVQKFISTSVDYTIGLNSNGTVVTTPYTGANYDYYGQCNVTNWCGISEISAGGRNTVGLKYDGTVVAVGDNRKGQCNVFDWTNIVAVSSGYEHTVGLKSDGTVVAAGDNTFGQCNVFDWTNIVAVATGDFHTLGLKSDGTVVAIGRNKCGQCDVSYWTDIVAISAGTDRSFALKSNGTVVVDRISSARFFNVTCWEKIIAIAGSNGGIAGLKEDGTVVIDEDIHTSYGESTYNVKDWKNIVAISAMPGHVVGLKSDGTVVATGSNKVLQCNMQNWKLFNNVETLEEERRLGYQYAQYRSQGLCQHCGGTFKGLFGKKCSNCGKPKDYK